MLKLMRQPLDPNTVSREIEVIRTIISENIAPLELYLFGSVAEGKMTDQSDYDLLIVMKDHDSCKLGMKQYIQIRSRLPRRPIDVLWMSQAEFDEKKVEGGVAFIAFQDGQKLI